MTCRAIPLVGIFTFADYFFQLGFKDPLMHFKGRKETPRAYINFTPSKGDLKMSLESTGIFDKPSALFQSQEQFHLPH